MNFLYTIYKKKKKEYNYVSLFSSEPPKPAAAKNYHTIEAPKSKKHTAI